MKEKDVLRDVINDYMYTARKKTLKKILALLKKEDQTTDPLLNMTKKEKASFKRSLKEADEGKVTPHEEVMKRMKPLVYDHQQKDS